MCVPVRNLASFGILRKPFKITILGSNGGIGRHLALMLKLNKNVTELALHDNQSPMGLKQDLSNIPTKAKVFAYSGDKELEKALQCCNMLIITAGQSHTPKYPSREAMFEANAALMKKFMNATANACRCEMPFIHVVTNPVTSLVPLCADLLTNLKCYNPKRICGSSSVDSMRARTFLGEFAEFDPAKIKIPVIGGHSSSSITPLISQRKPKFPLTADQEEKIIRRIIAGATEVIKAKENKGSAQLSMAYCVSKFCDSIVRARNGEKDIVEVGFVPADVNELDYFCCQFTLDQNGIKDFLRLPNMSDFEEELYLKAIEDVKENVKKAKEFLKEDKEQSKLDSELENKN